MSEKADFISKREEFRNTLIEVAKKTPDKLAIELCNAILGDTIASFITTTDFYTKNYKGLAESALHQLKLTENPAKKREEYISLESFVKENFHIYPSTLASCFSNYLFWIDSIDDVIRIFIRILEDSAEFSLALSDVFTKIFHGVPIYSKSEDTYKIELEDNLDYLCMFVMGRDTYLLDLGNFPTCMNGYYFKNSDLDFYRAFFLNHWDKTESEIEMLRTPYRESIGLSALSLINNSINDLEHHINEAESKKPTAQVKQKTDELASRERGTYQNIIKALLRELKRYGVDEKAFASIICIS